MMQHSFWAYLKLQRRVMSYLLICPEENVKVNIIYRSLVQNGIGLPAFGKRKLLHYFVFRTAY